uniref:Solute carrier family 46 member 3 n=1 Tax=Electrophorus electricus TaxID=8005 RepID=A0AAY5F1E1_ELEEL
MGWQNAIELVVGLHALAMFMTYPLLQQYVHQRLWQQLGGYAYSTSMDRSLCTSNSSNLSLHQVSLQAVQRETSRFLLHSELCFLLPGLVSSLFLVSYSDWRGRKAAIVPPLVGDLLFTLTYFVVSRFSLSLGYLLGASFLAGILGGPGSLIGGCFCYVADRSAEGPPESRTVRMARLDAVLGTLSGLGSLCTGFYVRAAGFSWPFLSASALHLLNLLYVLAILQEPSARPGHGPAPKPSASGPRSATEPTHLSPAQAIAGRLQGIYLLFASSTQRRNTGLLLMLSAFSFYKVSKLGGMSMVILYELNAPLCWSEVLIGYGAALSTLIYLSSFAGVAVLSRWLPDPCITLLGMFSLASGLCLAAFAKTTLLMFLVRLPLLLSIMPAPVMRSMMSKLVRSSEQGTVFACVAFVEMLSMAVALPLFTSTYAATVSWFSGFSFLLAASLTLIPAILIGTTLWLRLDVGEESDRLTPEDDAEDSARPAEVIQLPQWHK